MFENKLAQSVQHDYHQAADNHRLSKAVGNKSSQITPLKVIAVITPLFIFIASFI
ncbi:MAG: hypothetical protein AB8G95_24805 [Anaerolineae bacterium]